jgi:cytochrome P450
MSTAAVLELTLLAVLSWPWTRLVIDRRRRLARTAPLHHAALAGGLAAAGGASVLLAIHSPAALHASTAVAALAGAAAWWRARPSRGRARGLPPGSLAVTRSLRAIVDRDFYAAEARRHGPVFKMAQFHRPVACVVGLERGHDLMRRHRESLGPSPLPWNHELRGGFLRYMDDATHDLYGSLFRVALAGPVVTAAEPATRRAARRELAALAAACATAPAAGAQPGAALDRIVLAAFARVLFGIEEQTPAFAVLERRHADLEAQSLSARLTARSRAALDELRALVERRSRELETGAANGDTRCALAELRRLEPAMPDGVCIDNLLFILKIATGNVGALLRWIVKILGEHPRWSERLRAELGAGLAAGVEPEGGPRDLEAPGAAAEAAAGNATERTPSLADRIVMETLRLEQSEYLYRVVRREFEHGGFVFPAGWQLRLCVKESHRSEQVWSDPGVFDPDRFLHASPTRSQYSPFGFHQHACNGVDLNNMICRVTLEELARFDWRVVGDGELERDFRHWSHWRPSSRLRVFLGGVETIASPAGSRDRLPSPRASACDAPAPR